MRTIFLLTCLLICRFSFAQDTILGSPGISMQMDLERSLKSSPFDWGDCAHGHICCQVACRCCLAFHRSQIYDTIYSPVSEGVTRITVVERFGMANTNEVRPVHFRFKKADGSLSEKFFQALPYPIYPMILDEAEVWTDSVSFRFYPAAYENAYWENNQLLVIDKFYDHKLIDLAGNELPLSFVSRMKVSDGVYLSGIRVGTERIYGFTDEKGNKIGRLTYRSIAPTFDENGDAVFKDANWKDVLVDRNGKELLTGDYQDIQILGKNRFFVLQEGECHRKIIGLDGRRVTKKEYRAVDPFSEGLALALIGNGDCVYIDTNGREVANVVRGRPFSDGRAMVSKQSNFWGYIDRNGKMIIPPLFSEATDFQHGVAVVQEYYDNKWYLIETNGNHLSSKPYAKIDLLTNGIARVWMQDTGYGLIDSTGKEIMACEYWINPPDGQSWFVNDLIIRHDYKDGKSVAGTCELVDQTGKRVMNLKHFNNAWFLLKDKSWNEPYPFLTVQRPDGMLNLIDNDGQELLKSYYNSIEILDENTALTITRDGYFLVDSSTGESFKSFPESRVHVSNGLLCVQHNSGSVEYFSFRGVQIPEF